MFCVLVPLLLQDPSLCVSLALALAQGLCSLGHTRWCWGDRQGPGILICDFLSHQLYVRSIVQDMWRVTHVSELLGSWPSRLPQLGRPPPQLAGLLVVCVGSGWTLLEGQLREEAEREIHDLGVQKRH